MIPQQTDSGWKRVIPRNTGGILAGIMLSALIPLLLLQTVIYIFWYRTRIQTERDANLEFARSVSLSFEAYIHDIRRQLTVLGRTIESDPGFSLVKAGSLLSILREQYPTVTRFSLVDDRSLVVASSNPDVVGLSMDGRDYMQALQSGQQWAVGNLIRGPLTLKLQFNIALKIRTTTGTDAVLVAVINPDTMGQLVLTLDRPAGGVFTLFDRTGTLVFFSGDGSAPHENWAKRDVALQKAMKGEESVATIKYPLDNKDHVVARVPIQEIGWTAGASRDVDIVMAPIYRNLMWVAILNGVIVLISVAAALLLSRFFIRKLGRLREHARLIAGGNFSSRADVGYPVELVELEKSFNMMSEQIRVRQESLQHAIGELKRSNQELERFAYVASHDLQEPLRVISGFVQLIEKKYKRQLDKEADRYMEFITDAVHRQQELIHALLTYSRLGRQELNLAPTDANAALRTAAQNLGPLIHDTKAAVKCDPLPVVQADRVQLVQLFQNLIHNGIKFKGSSPPVIHISARSEDSAWIFSVQDNGIGIEPQYWEQIFTMFKRLHTRKDYPGTGIGLAICKKIVERHGGQIWLDSRPGEGSIFFFTLKAVGEQQ